MEIEMFIIYYYDHFLQFYKKHGYQIVSIILGLLLLLGYQ